MAKYRTGIVVTVLALVFLTVVAILMANLGVFGLGAQVSELAKWGPVGFLAELVLLFGIMGRGAFKAERPMAIEIGPPDGIPHLEISRIDWCDEECYMITRKNPRIPIHLIPSQIGDSFEVDIPEEHGDILESERFAEIRLTDTRGNRWQVKRFRPGRMFLRLSCLENLEKIISDYGEPEE